MASASPQVNRSAFWTVRIRDDGRPGDAALVVTEPLARAMTRAARLREADAGRSKRGEPFDLSFSSLFIGLLAEPHLVGEWLREQFPPGADGTAAMLKRRGLDTARFTRFREEPVDIHAGPFLQTASVRQALDEAQRLAGEGNALDTRHVVGAYGSLNEYHDDDFRTFGVPDRRVWARPFGELMSRTYPQEAELWRRWMSQLPAVKTTTEVAAAPTRERETLDLSDARLEPHVAQALRRAAVLAGDHPIGAHHVISASVDLAGSSGSAAFKRLAVLVNLTPDPSGHLSPSTGMPVDPLRLSAPLRTQLTWGQRPPEGTSGLKTLWGRDLVTAALLCDEAPLAQQLQGPQHLQRVRDRWFGFVTADEDVRSPREWAAWWHAAGVPLPGPIRSGYATETDEGEDRLGVAQEAMAFARLILDRKVQPPLSIGLLGDWGSGKSFFMEQIKQQIASLKGAERPELFGNVVEIEFNAWHVSDANLWASMVTHLFDEIWGKVAPAKLNETPEQARERLTQQIDQAKGAVHEALVQVEMGRVALAKAEAELADKRSTLVWHAFFDNEAKAQLQRLAQAAGWQKPLDTINEVDDAIKALTASGNRLRQTATALLDRPVRYLALPTLLLAGVTVGTWLWVNHLETSEWVAAATKWLTTAVAGLGMLVTPLRLATGRVAALADKLGKIQKGYDDALVKISQSGDPKLQARAASLTNARREMESLEASVAAAKQRLAELMNRQATLDPTRRLGAFLQERAQSTEYRSQQGIISLVHRDFKELSNRMKALRTSAARPDGAKALDESGIKPFDRIVIYVDDLDRCRPDQVVKMLEAVHLLLALDLFVVVVAVDSRWLMRALEVHYRDLLGTDGARDSDGIRASTPQSYLEKIFQITYALGPMNPKHFAGYVASLADTEAGDAAATAIPGQQAVGPQPTPVPPPPSPSAHTPDDGPQPAVKDVSAKPATPETSATGAAPSNVATPKALPPLQAVHIDSAERALIVALAPLLPTPRIAKRLVNVYRVIKARKSLEDLEAFENTGRAESCLLMLAILFGRPAVAPELLRALHEKKAPFDQPGEAIAAAIQRRAQAASDPKYVAAEWTKLNHTLDTLKLTTTVAQCAREPLEIARYSLVSGHDWHTWV